MAKHLYISFLLTLFVGTYISTAQEIKIFKVGDFDLRGKVKSCLVSTDYGKEEYEFDEQGRLTKSITRFNDTDYDITHYKFEKGELVERRMENYLDGNFEPSTSIANFYTVDQTEPRITTEKIYSYDKQFLDSYQYHYDLDGNLNKIVRSDTNGEDETLIERTGEGRYRQETYFMNGVIQKSKTTTFDQDGKNRTVLSANYIDGIRNSATEKIFDEKMNLISRAEMAVDEKTRKFVPKKVESFTYDENGMASTVTTKEGNSESTQEFIYQYDNGGSGNWVKKIITPDNLYTTRTIKYYTDEKIAEKE